jgi:hypothetical protein
MCAGQDGQQCGKILETATLNPSDGRNPVLLLSNLGWPTDNGYPLLQASVPADFIASTGIIGCPDHGFLILEESDAPPVFPGFPSGKFANGKSVQFPFFRLKEPYGEHLRTGRTQTVTWDVNKDPTFWSPDSPGAIIG